MRKAAQPAQLQTAATQAMTDDERYRAGYGGSYTLDANGRATLVEATQPGTVSVRHPDAPRHLQPAADSAGAAPAADQPAAE